MDQLISIYDRFITLFPTNLQWIVSLAVFIFVAIGAFNLVKRSFIFLILLVLLIPASIPVLRSIFNGLIAFLSHLL